MADTWEIDIVSARCALISSDFSQQEPKLTAFISQDPDMIRSFQENKDIYSFIAAIAFNKTYEECLEFMPTGEVDEDGEPIKVYNPSGKARRGEAKTIVLGILYGRSVVTIADQLYSKEDWDDDKKVKQAQYVYDSVLKAFPALKRFMYNAQKMAHDKGYVETILGRRRHIPDMMLDEFEFKAEPGYVNPDVDPLDISTLNTNDDIPERVKKALYKELKSYKYYGQVIKRSKELHEVDHIKVINNKHKISEASRQCVNSVVQGSAADSTKMALLKVEADEEWRRLGGRVQVPVHDELVAEVPIETAEKAGEVLSRLMCDSVSFLPFSIKCDVTTSYHWSGIEYPCVHTRPESLENMTDSEIRWVQYHLYDRGYYLPIYKKENGDKPEGEEALGVNGKMSEEMSSFITDYKTRYNITSDAQFIQHIEEFVATGKVPNSAQV